MPYRYPVLLWSTALFTLLCGCGASPTASNSGTNSPRLEGESATLCDITQLTANFDRAGEAYFSPDMKWIIFEAMPKGVGQYQMYVARLKHAGDDVVGAGEPIRISPQPSRNTCGFFSPDGRSFIFASTAGKEDVTQPPEGYQRQGRSYRWDFARGMEIFRVDDWQQKLGDVPSGGSVNLATNPITNNNVYDAEGAYSPDGKWLVFCSLRSGDGDVYVMHPDGSHVVRLTDKPGYDGGPFFSPDGKRVVYRSDRKHNDLLQIFVGDLAFDEQGNISGLQAEHQITNDNNVNWGPYWHPDGRHIIYATSKHGHQNYELYVMRDDGSHNVRITYTDGADILPVFSNDGKYLMWTSKRAPDHTTQIFIAKFTPPVDW